MDRFIEFVVGINCLFIFFVVIKLFFEVFEGELIIDIIINFCLGIENLILKIFNY